MVSSASAIKPDRLCNKQNIKPSLPSGTECKEKNNKTNFWKWATLGSAVLGTATTGIVGKQANEAINNLIVLSEKAGKNSADKIKELEQKIISISAEQQKLSGENSANQAKEIQALGEKVDSLSSALSKLGDQTDTAKMQQALQSLGSKAEALSQQWEKINSEYSANQAKEIQALGLKIDSLSTSPYTTMSAKPKQSAPPDSAPPQSNPAPKKESNPPLKEKDREMLEEEREQDFNQT